MIMNLSGGGNPKNVLVVSVGEASATITVTDGVTTLTKASDAEGYAYFKNLDEGTWTVTAVNSSSHTAPLTPTVTITSTQTAYYVRLGFEFWLYDNSYADTTLNECSENSGGWASVDGRTANYITTAMTGGGGINAANSFDMSKYDVVSVLANSVNGYSGNKVQVRASNKTTVLAEVKLATGTAQQWLTIDVSAITAQAYVYIVAGTGDVIALRKCYLA